MIGILVIGHGALGEGFLQAAAHVFGATLPRVAQLEVNAQDDPQQTLVRLQQQVRELDDGSGVLVLSDICGATPCNVATKAMQPGRVELISGLSLPMLLRAITYRNEPLAQVVQRALAGGRDGVMHLSSQNNATTTG